MRRRDERAFAEWVEELYLPMLQTAMSYLLNRDRAEEVVQETWLAAIHRVSSFEGRSSLRSWIFAILRNRTKERLKQDRRRGELLQAAMREGRLESDPVTQAIADSGVPSAAGNPESLFLVGEGRRALLAALGCLPAKQQAVLRLRDIEGFTSQEVCASLGLSPGAQRALHSRARARLRRLLAPYLGVRRP